jgi:hypothetical protein
MNNSFLSIETKATEAEQEPRLRMQEGDLIVVIDALQVISASKEWSSLKTQVFDTLADRLNRELVLEAKQETPDTLKLNRLAGQLTWAEKYSDLSKLEQEFRVQLSNVRKLLYGNAPDGAGNSS